MPRPLILDLDTGIDDAFALLYALAHPDLELIGVTGTYGNVTVEQGVRNTLALLELFQRPDIPVCAGPDHASDRASFERLEGSARIHGDNGIGGVELPAPSRAVESQGAVDFIVEAYRRYGQELVVVPTGPSTTIAEALAREPGIAPIVFMGGALTVPGNIEPWAEANVHQDPAATDYLFKHAKDITMVGLDVTLQTLLSSEQAEQWAAIGTEASRAMAAMARYYIAAYEEFSPGIGGCALHDPLAVGIAADPSLAGYLALEMMADAEGPLRGRTIGDPARLGGSERVKVAVSVDAERFVDEFFSRTSDFLENLG